MINILFLKTISGFVLDWWAKKQQLKNAIHDNKIRLAKSASEFNHEWEMRALAGDNFWLKRISFIIVFLPLVLVYFYPKIVQNYFYMLGGFPDEYFYTVGAILGALWGSKELQKFKR